MLFIMDLIYLLTAVALSPVVLYRAVRYSRYRTGWSQRFGKITRKDPLKKCIWLHAVSLGEVNAARTVIDELKKRFSNFEIVISTTTDTGFARANALFGSQLQVFYFPFDISSIMYRAFKNIKPSVCLLMELEVWPNLVQIAGRLNVPVIVVNGRISDRSIAKYRMIKPLVKMTFSRLSLVLAQTQLYADRFIELGCDSQKVVVTGSLKYDTAQITDSVDGARTLAAALGIDNERLLVAGGTGNDEEKILLDAYLSLKQQGGLDNLRLVIVPRKPERFDEVAQLITQSGLPLVRYSRVKNGFSEPLADKQSIILGDTMGDLRKFYSLAEVIFVGRSLVPMGGSDMAEAAALAKCTLFGPYAFNFQQTVDDLLEADGAIMVKDSNDLLDNLRKCLNAPHFARKIARNGQNVIRKNQGATARTLDHVAPFLS